jgi:3D (Asp-Asp-Asp) domain-containing protein
MCRYISRLNFVFLRIIKKNADYQRSHQTMRRRQALLTAAPLLIFVFVIFSLVSELKAARLELRNAQEIALESEQYSVQLMNITMYAPLSAGAVRGMDYSGDPSLTASGEKVVPGETAAAGPNIPFGTRIYVEGFGWRTVNDRGGAIGPNDIDLAVSSKEESIKFGRQQRLVILRLPD